MNSTRRFRGATAAASVGVLAALVAGSLTTPASAAPAQAPDDCPAAVPLGTVTDTMVGEGLTVVKGKTPEAFKVEVLGVLDDGIGVDRDMVLINISDYPGQNVVGKGGGIWAGMSGSPVYVDGKLLGAISYTWTLAPSTLGGLTPAEDMYDILGLTNPAAAKSKSRVKTNSTVKLSSAAKTKLAKKAGVPTPKGNLQQLRVPLGVSGLSPKRINRLQADADSAGLGVQAYAAGRAAAPEAAAPAARPQPGGNFAAALTYGDVTLAGVGTTTAVCEDKALAFGHPMLLGGAASYGANDADAVAIVKDDTLGSFKLANIGQSFGTVDQDRLAGLRADLTTNPATADVTTDITNGDSGKQRTGTTKVTDQSWVSTAVFYGILGNYDSVFDEQGDGAATSNWTINGTRAGGEEFTVTRGNRWADPSWSTIYPAFEVADAVDQLYYNEYESVKIDSVTFDSTATTKFDQLSITKLAVKVNGGKYTSAKRLSLKVGDKLKLKVTLRPYRSTTTKTTTLALTVPSSARGQDAVLSATGGLDLGFSGEEEFDTECLLEGDCEEAEEGSLDAVISSLTSAPRNDEVVADLSIESEEGDSASVASSTKQKTRVVNGSRSVEVSVRR